RSVPAAARACVSPLANVYRLRRRDGDSAGGRRRALRPLGREGRTRVTTGELEAAIKAQAFGLGFDLAGITTTGPAERAAAFDDWLARGYAGEMTYMARTAERRRDSRLPVAGSTSAVVVAMSYGGHEPSGPVARYARGDDYHDVMLERLNE